VQRDQRLVWKEVDRRRENFWNWFFFYFHPLPWRDSNPRQQSLKTEMIPLRRLILL
jgi:hypothetical protein